MAYSYENYANSTGSAYITDYTGKVKYYYFDSESNQIDAQFQCENASFIINAVGVINWKRGIWKNGYWHDGTFENQISSDEINWQDSQDIVSFWEDGYWNSGYFKNAEWTNGTFNSGYFENSIWFGGIFGYSNLTDNKTNSVFYESKFYGGLFVGSQWNESWYYTNGSYWFTLYVNEHINLWNGGYIDDEYSSAQPQNIFCNNLNYNNYTGSLTQLIIEKYSYRIKNFSCNSATFFVNNFGILTSENGIFYYGDFENDIFNNSTIQNSTISHCNLNQTTANKCSTIQLSVINNPTKTIQFSNLNQCKIYSSTIQNCIVNNCDFYQGTIKNSSWYGGVFNVDQYSTKCYWQEGNIWYSGKWNSGYINGVLSSIAPYIISNTKVYENYTGDLAYNFSQQKYIFSVTNATFTVLLDGRIVFESGIWENGTFASGSFLNGQFNNGSFLNGEIQNSVWNNGVFENGTFYSGIWNDGQFNGGQFVQSIWNDGQFNGGQFIKSTWNNGVFNNGNWNTLGSFWFGGQWNNGTQNGKQPSYNRTFIDKFIVENFLESDTVTIFDDNNVEQEKTINRLYKVPVTSLQLKIELFDSKTNRIDLEFVSDLKQNIDDNFCYYFRNNYLYVHFPNVIDDYYQLQYSYNQNDLTPTVKYVQQFKQYLSDINNLISGQFCYVVYQEQNQNVKYYSISVQNANFNIDNGFIRWNRGTFVNGTWYDGQWNILDLQLNDLIFEKLQQLLLYTAPCIWQDGVWMNGNWNYKKSKWLNGQWIKGTVNNVQCLQPPVFQLGNGKKYYNYNGILKYIATLNEQKRILQCNVKDAILQFDSDGYITFLNGQWISGQWANGQWYGKKWVNGIWHGGIWKCGSWNDGIWKEGIWEKNIRYIYGNNEYSEVTNYGCYQIIGKKYIKKSELPFFGFIIRNNIQIDLNNSSQSNNSDSSFGQIDFGTQKQFNSLQSDNSEQSVNSLQNQEFIYADQVVWVDSIWNTGFIIDVKSSYPPIYQVANNKSYFNKTQFVVYKFPIYNNNEFLYYQYFLLQFIDATLSIDVNGNITWYSGILKDSYWKNGIWHNGQFLNSQWENGQWYNGDFLSGIWHNGTWYNGNLNTTNSFWNGGIWKKGVINNKSSQYSPTLTDANNKLFINYTGTVKYCDSIKYYKISVSNAYFAVSNDGNIAFFNGTWEDGTWTDGAWTTAQFNQEYSELYNYSVLQLQNKYSFGTLSYSFSTQQNQMLMFNLKKNNQESKQIKLFNSTNNYNSVFKSGVFCNGIWYNGQWISGQWLTDENNNPIASWVTGVISGVVQKQPPIYITVGTDYKDVTFSHYTGTIKYYVIPYDFIQQRLLDCYFSILSVKDATFTIKYIYTTRKDVSYYQVFIQWQDGIFLSGQWYNGIWNNGTWNNGTWRIGIWNNGTWNNGNWSDGMWYNGIWNGGTKQNIRIMNQIY